jgi:hypothetical protein
MKAMVRIAKFHLILSLLTLIPMISLVAQDNQPAAGTGKPAEITFEKLIYDYGKIPYGEDGTYQFKFKNTGKGPLVITNVKSSCGCTIPEYPKAPIPKKKAGQIQVKYDTKRQGQFYKTIQVYSNGSKDPITLTIKGEVTSPTPEELEKLHQNRTQNTKPPTRVKKDEKSNMLEKEKSLPEKK